MSALDKLYHGNQKTSAIETSDLIKITHEEFSNDSSILNEKLIKAAKAGFFYLEIPPDSAPLIERATQFANTFYQNEELKQLKLEGFNGYHDRDNCQVESLYLERKYWEEV